MKMRSTHFGSPRFSICYQTKNKNSFCSAQMASLLYLHCIQRKKTRLGISGSQQRCTSVETRRCNCSHCTSASLPVCEFVPQFFQVTVHFKLLWLFVSCSGQTSESLLNTHNPNQREASPSVENNWGARISRATFSNLRLDSSFA